MKEMEVITRTGSLSRYPTVTLTATFFVVSLFYVNFKMNISTRYQLFRFSDPTVRFILDAKMINIGCKHARAQKLLRVSRTAINRRARCHVAFSLSDVDATINWHNIKLDCAKNMKSPKKTSLEGNKCITHILVYTYSSCGLHSANIEPSKFFSHIQQIIK